MKQFLLLLHEDIEKMKTLSPKDMGELAKAHMAWAGSLSESGHLLGGDGLHEKSVLISGQNSIVKDGSFLESKELIGGYYVLQAENLDTAIEISKACPCHLWGGTTKIRPIMDMDEYEQ